MNCTTCRINLAWARENPAEIDRLKREAPGRMRSHAHALDEDETRTSVARGDEPILRPALMLLASFVFAFCLGEAVHELGHYLAHRAFGVVVGIHLDPFGGSRILGGGLAPQETLGFTSAAGPLLNVVAALVLFLLLWWVRRPVLLPLLLWGPIALVQEGVTFSLGLLTPGGDAALIVGSGVPASIVLALGALYLVSGIAGVCTVLPLAGLSPCVSFGTKFGVVAGGMVSFMVVRFLYAAMSAPGQAQENLLPLLFSLLLAAVVAGLYGPLHRIAGRISAMELAPVPRATVALAGTLGAAMVVFQLAWFN